MLFNLAFVLALVSNGVLAHSNTLTPADYMVTGLEKYGAEDSMYSGYMPINLDKKNDEGAYFFWLAEMRGKTKENPGPLVIWLNGTYML